MWWNTKGRKNRVRISYKEPTPYVPTFLDASILTAISTSVSGIQADVVGMIGDNLPVIAVVFGTLLAITIGIKLVRRVAK